MQEKKLNPVSLITRNGERMLSSNYEGILKVSDTSCLHLSVCPVAYITLHYNNKTWYTIFQ